MHGVCDTARVIRSATFLLALEALFHSSPGHCYYSAALIMWVALVSSVSYGPLYGTRDVRLFGCMHEFGASTTPGMFGSLGPHLLTAAIMHCTTWANLPELRSAWLPQDVSPWSVHLPTARGDQQSLHARNNCDYISAKSTHNRCCHLSHFTLFGQCRTLSLATPPRTR